MDSIAYRPERPLVVKCTFDSKNKRITFDSARTCTYALLKSRVEQGFSLFNSSFIIQYKDDDGEVCPISSEDTLSEAIEYYQGGVDDHPMSSAASILSGRSLNRRITLRVQVLVDFDGRLSDTSSIASIEEYKDRNGSTYSMSNVFRGSSSGSQRDEDSETVSFSSHTEEYTRDPVPSAYQAAPLAQPSIVESDAFEDGRSFDSHAVAHHGTPDVDEAQVLDLSASIFDKLRLQNSPEWEATSRNAQWLREQSSLARNALIGPSVKSSSSSSSTPAASVAGGSIDFDLQSLGPNDGHQGLGLDDDLLLQRDNRGKYYYTYKTSTSSHSHDSGYEESDPPLETGSIEGESEMMGESMTYAEMYPGIPQEVLQYLDDDVGIPQTTPPPRCPKCSNCGILMEYIRYICSTCGEKRMVSTQNGNKMGNGDDRSDIGYGSGSESSGWAQTLGSSPSSTYWSPSNDWQHKPLPPTPSSPPPLSSPFHPHGDHTPGHGPGHGHNPFAHQHLSNFSHAGGTNGHHHNHHIHRFQQFHQCNNHNQNHDHHHHVPHFPPRGPHGSGSSRAQREPEEIEIGYELCSDCIQSHGVDHAIAGSVSGTAGPPRSPASPSSSHQHQPGNMGHGYPPAPSPTTPTDPVSAVQFRRTAPKQKGHFRHAFIEKVWSGDQWIDLEQEKIEKCSICESRLTNKQFKCSSCPNYHLCIGCYSQVHEIHPLHAFLLLSTPTNEQEKKRPMPPTEPVMDQLGEQSMTHAGVKCAHCAMDIVGARFHCAICESIDICSNCESAGLPGNLDAPDGGHTSSHIMIKIPFPLGTDKVQSASRRAMRHWTGRDPLNVNRNLYHPGKAESVRSTDAETVIGPSRDVHGGMNHDEPGERYVDDHGVLCDSCRRSIVGVRYQCANCPSLPKSYNLCSSCEVRSYKFHDPRHAFFKLTRPVERPIASETGIFPELYEVPAGPPPRSRPSNDPQEYLKMVQHKAALCDRCMDRITGAWFHCVYCPKDLCSDCEALDSHDHTHFFVVFKSTLNMPLFRIFGDLDNPNPRPLMPDPVYFSP